MAADLKTKYPAASADSIALTCTLASLATSSTLLAGREATAVDNTTNLDLDHLLSGVIRVGTTPTIDTRIEVWVYAPIRIASGTPTYPDVLDGTDSDETITSAGVKWGVLRLVQSLVVDATTTDRDYAFLPVSVARLFGGVLPPFWGVFVTHNTGVSLNSTGSNHYLHYHRIQRQSV